MDRAATTVALIVAISGLAIIPTPVMADDAWSDQCRNAETISPGTHSGQLSPEDHDAFIVELSKGDYLNLSLKYNGETARGIYFKSYNSKVITDPFASSISISSSDEWTDITDSGRVSYDTDRPAGEPARFRIYNEGPEDSVCIVLDTYRDEEATPWQLTFSLNDAEPPAILSAEDVDQVEEELESKIQRIDTLESMLEEKNRTIAELKSSSDVSINITVSSKGESQNFVAGEQAQISVESQQADLEELTVEYQGDMYSIGDRGQASIPLSGSGAQELSFTYQNTTKAISLNVEANSTTTPNSQGDSTESADTVSESNNNSGITDSDGDGVIDSEDYAPNNPEVQEKADLVTSESAPGFTPVVAISAFAICVGLLQAVSKTGE